MMKRVLMVTRPDALSVAGGDTIQMQRTLEKLAGVGWEGDISEDAAPSAAGYDVAHLFNIQDYAVAHAFKQLKTIVRQCIPIVVSPIYWEWDMGDVWHYASKGYGPIFGRSLGLIRLRKLLQSRLERSTGYSIRRVLRKLHPDEQRRLERFYQKRTVLEFCDVVMPGAEGEMRLLERTLGVSGVRYNTVPVGVSVPEDNGTFGNLNNDREPYVLCVGRIEPIKNQLAVIQALKGTSLGLVCVGKPTDLDYLAKCRDEGEGFVEFLPECTQNELWPLYATASAHVLVSWRETPGLANLEAGAFGCPLVVTTRGTTEEYFQEFARYCEPNDVSGIRTAVLEAVREGRNIELQTYIRTNYTWERAAQETARGYELALSLR